MAVCIRTRYAEKGNGEQVEGDHSHVGVEHAGHRAQQHPCCRARPHHPRAARSLSSQSLEINEFFTMLNRRLENPLKLLGFHLRDCRPAMLR